MALGDSFTVVVHQVRSPENLGAIARLMANFGFERLILSDPRTHGFEVAEKMAIRADHVLGASTLVDTLPEALTDIVHAVGTTSRAVEGRPALTPEEGIASLWRHAQRGPVALVLGGEKRGLSDDDLTLCQELIVIPTSATQPSMNLSQAAAVLLYLASRMERPEPRPEVPPGARLGTVQALEKQMTDVLTAAGFLNPQSPEYVRTELTLSLMRGELTQRECELWLTAFKKLGHAIKRGG